MSAEPIRLGDEAARRTAMSDHDRSFLVEAGAGSGKTAIMAGRIAMMLAAGTKPKTIAAITFTELAASELLERIREFVEALLAGHGADRTSPRAPRRIEPDPEGQSLARQCGARRNHLHDHPRLLPAADQALSCRSQDRSGCRRRWTRRKPTACSPSCSMPGCGSALHGADGALIAEMVTADPTEAVKLITEIAEALRRGRTITVRGTAVTSDHLQTRFSAASRRSARSWPIAGCDEPETRAIAALFARMAEDVRERCVAARAAARLVGSGHGRGSARALQAAMVTSARTARRANGRTPPRRPDYRKADGDRLNDQAEGHYNACC